MGGGGWVGGEAAQGGSRGGGVWGGDENYLNLYIIVCRPPTGPRLPSNELSSARGWTLMEEERIRFLPVGSDSTKLCLCMRDGIINNI